MSDLLESFHEHYEIALADTQPLKDEIFRLRYRVICEGMQMPGYERWRFPDGREIDGYDDRSVHALVRHRANGKIAGTVRLILADPELPERPFPIEAAAGSCFDGSRFRAEGADRLRTAEISRLILDRTSLDRGSPELPLLGMLACIVRLSSRHGVRHWLAVMEPLLNRLLRRYKSDLIPIGPVVEYHGQRQPHAAVVDQILGRVYGHRHDVWNLYTGCGLYWPPPAGAVLAPEAPGLAVSGVF